MATSQPQKQLLTLIRDFAAEKSHGERTVVGLKKRIDELRTELCVANEELEGLKRTKETIEQELKGYEVELELNATAIRASEARNSQIQDEISAVGLDVEALKTEEGASRDKFIGEMSEINSKIRKFHEDVAFTFRQKHVETLSVAGSKHANKEDTEITPEELENDLARISSQIEVEKQQYEVEKNISKQVKQELVDLERKVSLMEKIVQETNELQDLTKQTSELEETFAAIGDDLHRKCVCPKCHRDNVEALGGRILQAFEGN